MYEIRTKQSKTIKQKNKQKKPQEKIGGKKEEKKKESVSKNFKPQWINILDFLLVFVFSH